MAGDKQVAADFEKIIHEARDRKKNEALAAKIFGKDRRSSAPQKATTPVLGGSLASRVGVKKRVASTGPRGAPAPKPAYRGDIDGEWTHDLHDRHSAPSTPQATMPAAASLASRITDPSAGPAARIRGNQRRAAQVAQALIRTELAPSGPRRQPPTGPRAPAAAATSGGNSFNRGLTIRGLAGPFVVMAQNFAPGTTAADIESAMTPVGGLVTSCRLLKTTPIVIAEIVFESKEGADNVIATFNNQTADGRVLHVYYKVGGGSALPTEPRAAAPAHAPSGPRADRDPAVIDGSMGFDDPMETDDRDRYSNGYVVDTKGYSGGGNAASGRPRSDNRAPNGSRGGGAGGLYSDSMVQSNRRGRGYGRGGRGGPGR